MSSNSTIDKQKQLSANWFRELRDNICQEFKNIEAEWLESSSNSPSYKALKHINASQPLEHIPEFSTKEWSRGENKGGGVMASLKGNVFEKAGVNISTVYGEFSQDFRGEIPGTEEDPSFYATGISIIAHMNSPFVPAAHFNTRFIVTKDAWFGGGADLNPIYNNPADISDFHAELEATCNKYDTSYYPDFSKQCEDYFYIKHREEPRGAGGIFFDYLNNNNLRGDFEFVKDIGRAFLNIYPQIIRSNMYTGWDSEHREEQLIKRGRYVEFNLLYDRGTRFGLMTGGNPEAVLTSMPPVAKWK
jgi:coproporphyrinogen III oxidase